jgi:hypothetical protein
MSSLSCFYIDERLLSYVQVRFPGYIRNAFANATYQYVRKGEALFILYSPDPRGDPAGVLLALQNQKSDVEGAAIEGAVQRLRPKLMTVCAVLASLVPILWESGIGSDVNYLDHSRPDPGACLFCHNERTGAETRNTRSQGSGIHLNPFLLNCSTFS